MPMATIKTKQNLIEEPFDEHCRRPHVVLLGAGASLAAFPDGDASGYPLPLMDNLVETLGLQSLLKSTALEYEDQSNFEIMYSMLAPDPSNADLLCEIERRIETYFTGLLLPSHATMYDRLLLSLRPSDAVFTFNWDPFLFDAYQRNRQAVSLPGIFFLHGNVRIGACLNHDEWGARGGHCSECGNRLTNVPLLYPIEKKDYSKDPYIRRNWEAAETLLAEAFALTIFGYGAPTSDKDAVELLRLAWLERSDRTLEHVEIIDILDSTTLYDRWSPFNQSKHHRVSNTFQQSRLSRWLRRSCESILYPMRYGVPCEDFPLPPGSSLVELQKFAADIAQYEAG